MGILRLMLAIIVVIGHMQYANLLLGVNVFIAVKAFFIISGYYMAMILTEKYNDVPVYVFWRNRLLRLMPIYYFVLFLSIIVALFSNTKTIGLFINLGLWKSLLSTGELVGVKVYLLLTNISAMGIETTIYGCLDLATKTISVYGSSCKGYLLNNYMLIPQAWSISIELLFYAAAPFVVRQSNTRLAVMICAAAMLRVSLTWAGLDTNPWNRNVAPFEMIYFFIGVASFRLYSSTRELKVYPSLACASMFGIWIFTMSFGEISTRLGLRTDTENWLWWVYFMSLSLSLPLVFRLMSKSRLDNVLGELSYPVYICHILVLGMLDQYGGRALSETVGPLVWRMMNVAAVLLFAQFLVMFVSAPVDRYRHTLLEKQKQIIR